MILHIQALLACWLRLLPCCVATVTGGAALIQAVQANSTLQYLNLAYNAIPSACQQELRDVWTREREGLQLGLHL